MLIDDDEKKEYASVGNSLMKKVKIKNEFEREQKKIKKMSKKTYTQRVKERVGEYYVGKPFEIHAKRRRDKYGEISNVIKKAMKMLQGKNLTKTQTMIVESSKTKTRINHQRQRKKLRKQKNGGKQFKIVVIGKICL